ncbi:hypothetical protein PJP10_32260, partial [Mycobacterium kansasii]
SRSSRDSGSSSNALFFPSIIEARHGEFRTFFISKVFILNREAVACHLLCEKLTNLIASNPV